MKIIFAGTPSFSSFHLGLLINSHYEVPAVFTQPDRKSGRGKKVAPSSVKLLAEKNKIPVLQPLNLGPKEEVLENIKIIKPDLMLVVAYGIILNKEVLNLPKHGCINVHASILPRWRGAAPIERSIINGDKKGGISFMKMNEGLDTGPVLKSFDCEISADETSETLEKKYLSLSQKNLIDFLDDFFKDEVKEHKQNESLATYADKIDKNETKIKWDIEEAEFIERKVRAFYPKYGAFSFLGDIRIKILKSELSSCPVKLDPGEVFISDIADFFVGCKNSSTLKIKELQAEGKNPTIASEFVKGNKDKILNLKKFH